MDREDKLPFDIDEMLVRIGEAVKPYPKAMMFQLAEEGYSTLFEQLIACIISIRTLDEVSGPAARRLFSSARTPQDLSNLSVEEIDRLISPCTYHEDKAKQILNISRRILDEYGGNLQCDPAVLMSFRGVGVKCTNLALGLACGIPKISVDTHVHRVTNRWGYVHTSTPEQTTVALEQKLPEKYWVETNALLMPFGKHICTPTLPKCSTCPVLEYCRQVGVTKHR
jgi:endonuclease-3